MKLYQRTYTKNDLSILDCSFGFYGQDCADTCNHTCSGCNNVNGQCDRGCNPGWSGELCEKGILCDHNFCFRGKIISRIRN